MKNISNILIALILFCPCFIQGQNKMSQNEIIILGIKNFDQLVLVRLYKMPNKDEQYSVFTEKNNIKLLTKKGTFFRYHIFDTHCYSIYPYANMVYELILPIASPEINEILKQMYPYSSSQIDNLFTSPLLRYGELAYSDCKYHKYLVVLIKLTTYNKYMDRISYSGSSRERRYRFKNNKSKQNKYIKVLIPLKE